MLKTVTGLLTSHVATIESVVRLLINPKNPMAFKFKPLEALIPISKLSVILQKSLEGETVDLQSMAPRTVDFH